MFIPLIQSSSVDFYVEGVQHPEQYFEIVPYLDGAQGYVVHIYIPPDVGPYIVTFSASPLGILYGLAKRHRIHAFSLLFSALLLIFFCKMQKYTEKKTVIFVISVIGIITVIEKLGEQFFRVHGFFDLDYVSDGEIQRISWISCIILPIITVSLAYLFIFFIDPLNMILNFYSIWVPNFSINKKILFYGLLILSLTLSYTVTAVLGVLILFRQQYRKHKHSNLILSKLQELFVIIIIHFLGMMKFPNIIIEVFTIKQKMWYFDPEPFQFLAVFCFFSLLLLDFGQENSQRAFGANKWIIFATAVYSGLVSFEYVYRACHSFTIALVSIIIYVCFFSLTHKAGNTEATYRVVSNSDVVSFLQFSDKNNPIFGAYMLQYFY